MSIFSIKTKSQMQTLNVYMKLSKKLEPFGQKLSFKNDIF